MSVAKPHAEKKRNKLTTAVDDRTIDTIDFIVEQPWTPFENYSELLRAMIHDYIADGYVAELEVQE